MNPQALTNYRQLNRLGSKLNRLGHYGPIRLRRSAGARRDEGVRRETAFPCSRGSGDRSGRVVLPAARPGVIAVAIYSFMTAWGEVLFASVMTTEANRTLSVGLRQYSTQTNIYWNQIMAAALVVSVPVVIGFLLAQRHF